MRAAPEEALVSTRLVVLLLVVILPREAAAQAGAVNAPHSRIGFFSPQRAFAQSDAGKAVHAKLSALQAEHSKEVEARSAQLKGLQAALAQSSAVLREEVRRQRELELERFELDMKRFVEDAQAEFLGVQRDLESAFLEKLRPALDAVAKDRGLALVFNADAGVLAWSDPALDITPDVVQRVDLAGR
jgi:Skp family chaperone for outer membrane proteins